MTMRFAGKILAGVACLTLSVPSLASDPIAPGDETLGRQLATLATGKQMIVALADSNVTFAGETIALSDFEGVFGYASEVAYVVVVRGEARIGKHDAGRGRMLLIRPFDAGISVERFDAMRLQDALVQDATDEVAVGVLANMRGLARGQRRGMFLGRLSQNNFNLASLGSSVEELDRRSRVGGTAVRDARFETSGGIVDIEQAIVERFVAAMVRGDSKSAAEFLDPLPYNSTRLSDDAARARELTVVNLLQSHDWDRFAGLQATSLGENRWSFRGTDAVATIVLRRTTEFAFIQSIEVGE